LSRQQTRSRHGDLIVVVSSDVDSGFEIGWAEMWRFRNLSSDLRQQPGCQKIQAT
jgi:hypothetical protein